MTWRHTNTWILPSRIEFLQIDIFLVPCPSWSWLDLYLVLLTEDYPRLLCLCWEDVSRVLLMRPRGSILVVSQYFWLHPRCVTTSPSPQSPLVYIGIFTSLQHRWGVPDRGPWGPGTCSKYRFFSAAGPRNPRGTPFPLPPIVRCSTGAQIPISAAFRAKMRAVRSDCGVSFGQGPEVPGYCSAHRCARCCAYRRRVIEIPPISYFGNNWLNLIHCVSALNRCNDPQYYVYI